VDVRALAVKAEFADIENLKNQMLSKDEAVTEMRRLLKAKVGIHTHSTFISFSSILFGSDTWLIS